MNKKLIKKLVINIEELSEDIKLDYECVWVKNLGHQIYIEPNYYSMTIQLRKTFLKLMSEWIDKEIKTVNNIH